MNEKDARKGENEGPRKARHERAEIIGVWRAEREGIE
jgi:hypothetical protein